MRWGRGVHRSLSLYQPSLIHASVPHRAPHNTLDRTPHMPPHRAPQRVSQNPQQRAPQPTCIVSGVPGLGRLHLRGLYRRPSRGWEGGWEGGSEWEGRREGREVVPRKGETTKVHRSSSLPKRGKRREQDVRSDGNEGGGRKREERMGKGEEKRTASMYVEKKRGRLKVCLPRREKLKNFNVVFKLLIVMNSL